MSDSGVVVKVGSLLACISHVESEVTTLGIQNERNLVDLLHGSDKLLVLALRPEFEALHGNLLLLVLHLELGAQHVDSLTEVALLEDGMSLRSPYYQDCQNQQ